MLMSSKDSGCCVGELDIDRLCPRVLEHLCKFTPHPLRSCRIHPVEQRNELELFLNIAIMD